MEEQKTTNSESDEPTTQSATPTEQASQNHNKLFTIVLVCLLVAGIGWYFLAKNSSDDAIGEQQTGSLSTTANYPETVAVIDGEPVSRDELILSIKQAEQVAAQQGADINDPAVQTLLETQAMDILINTKLLAAAARAEAELITDEQVNNQFEQISQSYQSAEAFAEALADIGLSEEELRGNIRDQLAIEAYLTAQPAYQEVSVSEEEVTEAYGALLEESPELPTLEEIGALIEQQLLVQKQQQAISGIVDNLQAAAEIEVNI